MITRELNHRIAVVTTSIAIPKLLRDYAFEARTHSFDRTSFIFVGDKNTVREAYDFCVKLQEETGLVVHALDQSSQESYLSRFPNLQTHIPWNSIQRRNVGMMLAYEQNADLVITIDDDNYIVSGQDYFGSHSVAGSQTECKVISSSTGWFNVCQALRERNGIPFFPRGYPLAERTFGSSCADTGSETSARIAVNAGLWLGDPDIDAFARLTHKIESVDMKIDFAPTFALAFGTWAPFDSQNTAFDRSVIPAYFLSPYVGRYDDIFAGLIVRRIADHLGQHISFGQPLVRQVRNPHNLLVDFDRERFGYETCDRFCELLRRSKLTKQDYLGCAREIVNWMEGELVPFHGWTRDQRDNFSKYAAAYETWVEAFEGF